jgi:hypothetical protein
VAAISSTERASDRASMASTRRSSASGDDLVSFEISGANANWAAIGHPR